MTHQELAQQCAQMEKLVRVEVVSRALIEGYSSCAGIFAENHFTVQPNQINLEWNTKRFGRLCDREGTTRVANELMVRLRMPFKVSIFEVA
jgi:hypothetical protein